MRLVSTAAVASDIFKSKLTPPTADDAYFYTSGRMLSYNRPTKNGIIFFRPDCQPVLDTVQNALSTIAHIKPSNHGIEDIYRLKNSSFGSILKYVEDEEGIDIICKLDRDLVKSMGFQEADFSPEAGRFSSYSQESSFSPINSPFITVDPAKAKVGYFDPGDIVKTYSYAEGRALGLKPSFYDLRTGMWNYNYDPDGNAVFVRVRPIAFTGVGHVILPADETAEIYKYAASEEGDDIIAELYGKTVSAPVLDPSGSQIISEPAQITMESPDPAIALDNAYMNNYTDDFINHPDLGSPSKDLSSIDGMDDYDEGDEPGKPAVIYMPDDDDIYLNKEDLQEMRAFSKSMSSYIDQLIEDTDQILSAAGKKKAVRSPYGTNANYGDPGYRGDKKRYPLDTPEHIRAAAGFWGRAKNKSRYTPAQRAHISAKIKAAEARHKIGSYSNASYAAVWTKNHPEKPDKFVVNRRFRVVNDDGQLDREKLVSAYHSLSGVRGHTALVNDMPGPVKDHALALVRQGLQLTKNQIKEKSMSQPVDLTPNLTAELEDLKARAQALSSEKDASAAALEAVRQEFSSYKTENEALIAELKQSVANLEAEVGTFKSKELSSVRLAQLEAVFPFTDEERTEDFVQSLSSVSEDRMETLLLKRELAKTKAERATALSSILTPGATKVSPAPTFEGNRVASGTINPADYL